MSYDWKIDFAIILATVSLLISVVHFWFQRRSKQKFDRIRAYEKVYEDACWILMYPHQQRKVESNSLFFTHPDSEFKNSVRRYLSAHWMEQVWGQSSIVPKSILPEKRHEYFMRVIEAARKHQNEQRRLRYSIDVPEKSPVYHLENEEIAERLRRVLQRVGGELSRFSERIRSLWENAQFTEPEKIRASYEAALRVCPNFFKHNRRDFDDPFYDLLFLIRREYRDLTTTWTKKFRWRLERLSYSKPIMLIRNLRKKL